MSAADALVLIVDDDRTIVRLCQRLLERASYRVLVAMSPSEAEIFQRLKLDLLLTDIRMPVMDGFELIGLAKQFQPDLPVLVMTGYGSIENAIQALHRGVDGLILKPFENSAELVQTVERVLQESHQRRDAARLQALRPLFDVTERLLAETSPKLLEKRILTTVQGIFQTSYAGVYRGTSATAAMERINSSGDSQKIDAVLETSFFNLLLGGGSPLLASRNAGEIPEQARRLLEASGAETAMFAPVRRENHTFVLCAFRAIGTASFTEADLEMFIILARQAVVAMENARLYSELKDYVRQVEDSQRALIQAEKMAAVGRLVASLAHEINNPLQAVSNCVHLAGRKDLDNDQRLRYIEMTDRELDRLVLTVRRMLDFYRPGSVEKRKTDLRALLDHVFCILEPQFRDQAIKLNVAFSGEIQPVEIVPDQIQQVIFNLLLNALDALEESEPSLDGATSGEVVPSPPAADSREARQVWVDVYDERRQVRILIEDSGQGVPDGSRERIFEPFFSTKQHGTGLGLAVSFGIMERHQGSLSTVPSRYGAGACFEMIIPAGVEGQDGKNSNR
jgi:signal transduction histidine kinase